MPKIERPWFSEWHYRHIRINWRTIPQNYSRILHIFYNVVVVHDANVLEYLLLCQNGPLTSRRCRRRENSDDDCSSASVCARLEFLQLKAYDCKNHHELSHSHFFEIRSTVFCINVKIIWTELHTTNKRRKAAQCPKICIAALFPLVHRSTGTRPPIQAAPGPFVSCTFVKM